VIITFDELFIARNVLYKTFRAKRRCNAAPEPAANDVRAGERTVSRRLHLVGACEPREKRGPLHCAQVVSAARVASDDVSAVVCDSLTARLSSQCRVTGPIPAPG
jgi:hypothetical protein